MSFKRRWRSPGVYQIPDDQNLAADDTQSIRQMFDECKRADTYVTNFITLLRTDGYDMYVHTICFDLTNIYYARNVLFQRIISII